METTTLGWIGLIFILFVTTFGLFWLLTALTGLLLLLAGALSFLYIQQGDIISFSNRCSGNPLTTDCTPEGGLQQFIKQLGSPKKIQKSDSRVTGSELIDSSLQEILGYILRDYISTWYNVISKDKEFPQTTVRKTAQTFAINISNKIKEIDWIPYITTRLVDDAATHLKLFKQARTKMKLMEKPKSPRNSPMREKNSPKKPAHKRNKSETDITWYHGKAMELKRGDTEKAVGNSKFYSGDKTATTLEDHFFYLECQMENNLVCRDYLCTDATTEKEFLSEVIEVLLYILLPEEDFDCKPLTFVLREIFANCVVLPLFSMMSDPDYINQVIIWLCLREVSLPSEIFLTTLRLTDNCDELKCTKDLVLKEIQLLRSRDSGGESDLSIKQQLSSLYYLQKLIETRLSKMENLDSSESHSSLDYIQLETVKRIDLKLDQILKNNVALSYFIDFVSSQGKHAELFFYLNVEAWKICVEQQLMDLAKSRSSADTCSIYETIRSTASSIFEQYLSDKAEEKIQVKQSLVQSLYFKIINLSETPNRQWFDEIQRSVYEKMNNHEDYLTAFKRSKAYVKLLQELDLIQQNNVDEDSVSLNSNDGLEATESTVPKKSDYLMVETIQKGVKHARSFSDVPLFSAKNEDLSFQLTSEESQLKAAQDAKKYKTGNFSLQVNIIETGIVCEKGKTFGIYAISVSRQYETDFLEEWHIYRRYSDFHDLYTKIKDKYPDLGKIPFPGKKTFHNMDRAVLEKRMKMLGYYMHQVCQSTVLSSHPKLRDLLMTFLEQGEYDRTGGPISGAIETIVNPLKTGMKTIKNMPEQLINTMDEVVESINKVFHPKPVNLPEASKVGASIEETENNIPLRIMLLLMDEVFDLKSRNQWLRRRIVTLLRQIVRTMFGDIVNRRILDYVSVITSPKNVAHYLSVFKQSFWPNGAPCEKKPHRDDDVKIRTRVAAKVALLSCLSDELKHIIGSETTRRGLLTIFELFQRPILNRRLLYVLLEGVLCTLFPEKDMVKLFQTLHSKSKRIQDNKSR